MPARHQPATALDPEPTPRARAGALRDAAAGRLAAAQALPLRGRNVAVLCNDAQWAPAVALQQAARALGARVALIRSDLDAVDSLVDVGHTARVLGRLYDAVLCVDLAPAIVRSLRDDAGIPVISDELADVGAARPGVSNDAMACFGPMLAQLAAI